MKTNPAITILDNGTLTGFPTLDAILSFRSEIAEKESEFQRKHNSFKELTAIGEELSRYSIKGPIFL